MLSLGRKGEWLPVYDRLAESNLIGIFQDIANGNTSCQRGKIYIIS
jgi:hypothetical protein